MRSTNTNSGAPVTAIRNGDIDNNPVTERAAVRQPFGPTPGHPEYPCAHCIQSGAMAGAITAMLGTEDIPEVTLTSPSAPGVTHKYTNLRALNDEASAARIYAGFHYRFSIDPYGSAWISSDHRVRARGGTAA